MTKLEQQIKNPCRKEECANEFSLFDPGDEHVHFPESETDVFADWTFSDNPPTIHAFSDCEFTIPQLRELRDWLNDVLKEVDQ